MDFIKNHEARYIRKTCLDDYVVKISRAMMSILADHESRYFMENENVPDKPEIVWKHISGDVIYHLHMGKTDEENITFLIGSNKKSLKTSDVHAI